MALTVSPSEIVQNSSNRLLGKHESWARVLLGDVATVLSGFAFKSSEFSNSGGVPLIRIRDVGKDCSETTYLGEYDPRYVVKLGDLLVGMDGDFNCARWRGPRGLLNQRVCKITLKTDTYLPKFLDYTLPGYLKAINDVTSSVTV
jgi:type I restriction enzyme S subunit